MTQQGIKGGLKRLLEAFDRLDIPCMIVGSLASSMHGITRATVDVDVVADINEAKIDALAEDLRNEFCADAGDMKDAFRRGRAFNLIHYSSSYKFDVFPLTTDPFSQAEFSRRKTAVLSQPASEEPMEFPVASAEDTILSKLLWYKSGGETSERQWNDAAGIMRVRGNQLDVDYLRNWASRLGIDDLLIRLLKKPVP